MSLSPFRVVVAFLLTALAAWYFWPPPKEVFEKALPQSARDVSAWIDEDGFFPDYIYLLRARVSEAEFVDYISTFGLTPHTANRKYGESASWLSWTVQRHRKPLPMWWNPTASLQNTFVRQDGENWTFAKHESGYVYLKSLTH